MVAARGEPQLLHGVADERFAFAIKRAERFDLFRRETRVERCGHAGTTMAALTPLALYRSRAHHPLQDRRASFRPRTIFPRDRVELHGWNLHVDIDPVQHRPRHAREVTLTIVRAALARAPSIAGPSAGTPFHCPFAG